MSNVFVLRNENGEYLTKAGEWLSGGDCRSLYRSAHYDEAINEKVEITVKKPGHRIKIVEVETNEKNKIIIDGELFPSAASLKIEDEVEADGASQTEAQTETESETIGQEL